ncbi:hypothetical protein GCM10017566_20940 [Amycolatopsis bartoniae]|uniref:DUF1440 domain-containing protein n=2 Tax=Amycolatopsis bartoniae TaxID=941986 RepID=A0A8H9M992_9PSEU|nr:hypothetical protein GCM10017566_20940 [Amycolatopsis bartoniae]
MCGSTREPGVTERMLSSILRGMAAGAAGTTALNAVTYLDMVWRGRPASSTPEKTVETLSEKTGLPVPGEGEQRENRVSGLGPLMGLFTGVGVGALYGALRGLGWRPSMPVAGLLTGAAAMVGSSAPMTLLGITDPREWKPADWASDAVPHLAYGLVTAGTYAATTC